MPELAFRPFLGGAAKNMREAAGLRPRHIAAEIDVDPSTIYRFETEQETWPSNADRIVTAYAACLGVHPSRIWAEALRLWQDAAGARATAPDRANPKPKRSRFRR